MKRFDRLKAPGLAFLALSLAPANRFPIGREDQTRPRITNLDAVPAGLIHIQKESLLDSVLVRPALDEHTVFKKDIGRPQHFFAAIHRISQVVEPPPATEPVVVADADPMPKTASPLPLIGLIGLLALGGGLALSIATKRTA